MSELLDIAKSTVISSNKAFCRFITANDVGKTGSHQSGFYIPKDSWSVFFDTQGVRGSNKERTIHIEWNNDFYTTSHAKYYGGKTRNEYRLTNFGKNFPFLETSFSGSLLIIAKVDTAEYKAFVLNKDDDIDDFLSSFDISPIGNKHLIDINNKEINTDINTIIQNFLSEYEAFPSTQIMSSLARQLYLEMENFTNKKALKAPDEAIIKWIDSEYQIFKAFEEREFSQRKIEGLSTCKELIDYSISLLNRRKSRAGKSLEHHLSYIFTIEKIKFEEQVFTEGRKRPDFIFPNGESYHNILFPVDGLTFLGAKTTCKDRWRQVLNEADRISHKYLFTLQKGISSNQLSEMKKEGVTLVIPKSNIRTFAIQDRPQLLTLDNFITILKTKQNKFQS